MQYNYIQYLVRDSRFWVASGVVGFSGASSETNVPVWTRHIAGLLLINCFIFFWRRHELRQLPGMINASTAFSLCFLSGVFLHCRVTGACPVTTDLITAGGVPILRAPRDTPINLVLSLLWSYLSLTPLEPPNPSLYQKTGFQL